MRKLCDETDTTAPAAAASAGVWTPAPASGVRIEWRRDSAGGFALRLEWNDNLILADSLDPSRARLPFAVREQMEPQLRLSGCLQWRGMPDRPQLWLVDLTYPGGRVDAARLDSVAVR